MMQQKPQITYDDFQKLDVRVGRVVSCEPFPEGKYSTHVLRIDFGDGVGEKKSLAKLAPNYEGPELVGTLVMGVVNFPPRQIGPHKSEVLTLGFEDVNGEITLARPDHDVPLGNPLC